jgi:glucose-1-phosphate thymidylyltransferase
VCEQAIPNGLAHFRNGEEFIGDEFCSSGSGDNIFFGANMDELLYSNKTQRVELFCLCFDPERYGWWNLTNLKHFQLKKSH